MALDLYQCAGVPGRLASSFVNLNVAGVPGLSLYGGVPADELVCSLPSAGYPNQSSFLVGVTGAILPMHSSFLLPRRMASRGLLELCSGAPCTLQSPMRSVLVVAC